MKPAGPGRNALRKGRVTVPGHAYLITIVCAERRAIFECVATAGAAKSVFDAAASWPSSEMLAWVLMPDHWHGLLVPDGSESLGRIVQRVKALVTQEIRRQLGRMDQIWQPGFHDHGLRSEESLPDSVRYLLANPVRAGLVEHWSDWAHFGGPYALDFPL